MGKRIGAWLLSVVALGCAVPPPRTADPVAPPRTLALLVGIDEYAQPAHGMLPPLAGAEHDVRRVHEVLIERFGFDADDIRLLCGADATHAGIVNAFHEHLLQRAVAGTCVVFWFSGHGSRSLDLSGIETSKTDDAGFGAYDNSLLAWDSRAEERDGSYDFVDDELHSLLRALVKRTDQVLVVTDCCHSSGAVRGGAAQAPGVRTAPRGDRGVTADALAAFWPKDIALIDDDDAEAEPFGRFPYVHIAACAEHQEAGELRIGDRTFGTLSWFLTDAMEQMAPGTSWRQLVERVRARVAGCGTRPDQVVSAAGELDRPVFGASTSAPLRGFRVDQLPDGLCIDAGRVHGIVDGAEFEIVGLGLGSRHGLAKADTVAAAWCLARWCEGGGADLAGQPLRAMPRAGAMAFTPLRILVEGGLDKGLLDGVPWAVSSDGGDHEFRLQRAANDALLCDGNGRPLRPVPLARTGLEEALFRECTFRGLWESVARTGSWPVSLEVVPADAATCALGAQRQLPLAEFEAMAGGANAVAVRAVPLSATDGGSLITLLATNRSDRDLRLAILSVSEDRAVNVVWPRRSETDQIWRSGQSQVVTVLVGPAAGWHETRPMVDRYLVFATDEPADFAAFTSAAPVWSPSRGNGPLVPSFLRSLLAPGATRGAPVATTNEFGLAWCDLLLSPATVDGEAAGR